MATEVQIYDNGTIVGDDIANSTITSSKLSTGGPSWDTNGYLTATGFKVGAQTGFLKANGTVDTSTYLTSVPAPPTPGGSSGNIQYNDGSSNFAGSGSLTFNSTTNVLSCAGDIIAFASDERLKTNFKPIENAIDKVSKLNGFTYNFNETGETLGFDSSVRHAGVSAQEVQKVLTEAVCPAPANNNYLTVKYDKLVPLLIEAIKELSAKVEDLEKKLESI